MKGKLIVLEGTDSSGKETQSELLLKKLNEEKIPCEMMSFPRYNTPTGRIIGQCYLGKKDLKNKLGYEGDFAWFGQDSAAVNPVIASLYYAADRMNATSEIISIINSGKNLILNRYYQSNMAHQGGKEKDPSKRASLFEFLERLEVDLLKIPKEDLVIFLHMPTDVAVKLREKRDIKNNSLADIHEKDLDHLLNAEKAYLHLAEWYDSSLWRWKKISCTLDGTIETLKTPQTIHKEVYDIVKKSL